MPATHSPPICAHCDSPIEHQPVAHGDGGHEYHGGCLAMHIFAAADRETVAVPVRPFAMSAALPAPALPRHVRLALTMLHDAELNPAALSRLARAQAWTVVAEYFGLPAARPHEGPRPASHPRG